MLREIWVLNRSIDGKDVFSLPPFSGSDTSWLADSLVKDGMVAKGLLTGHDSFSERGAVMARRLALFKSARQRCLLNGIIAIAIGSGEQGVALIHDRYHGEYALKVVDVRDCASQLVSAFPLFAQGGEPDGPHMEKLGAKAFEALVAPKPVDSIHIQVESGGVVKADEVFCSHEGVLCVYDYRAGELTRISRREAIGKLLERLGVGNG
jgi:hypothetical protein